MVRALFWKEWREHRWKMAAIAAAYATPILAIWSPIFFPRHTGVSDVQPTLTTLALLLPAFMAMGTLTEERSRRTGETLRALPVRMEWVFLVKILAGIVTLVVPLAAVELFSWFVLFPANRGKVEGSTLEWSMKAMLLAVCLYLWTVALGSSTKSEIKVALMYVGLILLSALLILSARSPFQEELSIYFPLSLLADERKLRQGAVGHNLATLAPLILWAGWNYCRPSRVRPLPETGTRPRGAVQNRVRRFPVLWKSARETRMLVAGVLLVVLVYPVIELVRLASGSTFPLPGNPSDWHAVLSLAGVLLVIVLGTELGLKDFEGRMEYFWQSRPLGIAGYFWKRFVWGLICSIAMCVLTGVLIWGFNQLLRAQQLAFGIEAARVAMAFYAPLAGVIFAASMLFATLMRRRVVSMVFSLATALMLQTAAGMNRTMQHIAWYVREQVEPARVTGYILVCLIVTVLLGWLMVLSVKGNWRSRLEAAIALRRARAPRVDHRAAARAGSSAGT